jgi:hypothetical protein
LALADALCAEQAYREAGQLYQAVLDESSKNKAALLGLARSSSGEGRTGEAIEWYERLLELDRGYGSYSAALEYADALWEDGRKQDTVDLLEAIVQLTNRPNHKLAHAHYLIESGRPHDARQALSDLIQQNEADTPAQRKRNEKWIARARQLMGKLDAE